MRDVLEKSNRSVGSALRRPLRARAGGRGPGAPAFRIDIGGEVDTAVGLAVENGRVTRIYAIRNPHKLARLDGVAALTRT